MKPIQQSEVCHFSRLLFFFLGCLQPRDRPFLRIKPAPHARSDPASCFQKLRQHRRSLLTLTARLLVHHSSSLNPCASSLLLLGGPLPNANSCSSFAFLSSWNLLLLMASYCKCFQVADKPPALNQLHAYMETTSTSPTYLSSSMHLPHASRHAENSRAFFLVPSLR